MDYCLICTICMPRPRRTGTALDTGAIIKCDPACAGFQLAPAFRRTSASGFCHDGEYALAGVITSLRIVRTRTFADVEVVDGHTDGIRHRRLLLRIDRLTIRVEHKVARILIRTLFRIGKVMVSRVKL